mmetsp:Transcript_48542/g.95761  ORF Transcript_48542/g.95761 Transcript_48542/m.95761 type:complete len:285 (-) Transcript_48542:149-1003(-)
MLCCYVESCVMGVSACVNVRSCLNESFYHRQTVHLSSNVKGGELLETDSFSRCPPLQQGVHDLNVTLLSCYPQRGDLQLVGSLFEVCPSIYEFCQGRKTAFKRGFKERTKGGGRGLNTRLGGDVTGVQRGGGLAMAIPSLQTSNAVFDCRGRPNSDGQRMMLFEKCLHALVPSLFLFLFVDQVIIVLPEVDRLPFLLLVGKSVSVFLCSFRGHGDCNSLYRDGDRISIPKRAHIVKEKLRGLMEELLTPDTREGAEHHKNEHTQKPLHLHPEAYCQAAEETVDL